MNANNIDHKDGNETGSKSSILIIDDEDQIRALLRVILEEAGYRIFEAANGKTANRIFLEEKIDLIITDIIMPEKDGIETIMEFREKSPDVKIIAISGGGHIGPEGYLHTAKQLGASDTITKPFSQEKIVKAVQDALG